VAAAPQAPPYGPKATRLNTPLPWTQPMQVTNQASYAWCARAKRCPDHVRMQLIAEIRGNAAEHHGTDANPQHDPRAVTTGLLCATTRAWTASWPSLRAAPPSPAASRAPRGAEGKHRCRTSSLELPPAEPARCSVSDSTLVTLVRTSEGLASSSRWQTVARVGSRASHSVPACAMAWLSQRLRQPFVLGKPRWYSAPCRPRQLVALPEGTEPAYNLRGSLVAWQGGSLRRQPRGRGPRCDAGSASWSAAGTSAA